MKKFLYLICSLALTVTACDPMEDVYDELDAVNTESDLKMALTLTPAHYKVVTNKTYFLSEEDAAAKIPAILDNKFPHLDNGTLATITYNSATTVFTNTYVSTEEEYTVTDEDYAALNFKYGNFDSADDMVTFLNYKYPNAEDKQLVKLTFDWYSGAASPSTQEKIDHFFFVNGEWVDTYVVTEENYESVEHTKYSFSSSDGANLDLYLDKFLRESVLGAKPGDVQYVSYAYYSSSSRTTSQRVTAMAFDGTSWKSLKDSVTEEATLNLSKQKGIWVPDLSIRYTLVADDYGWIAQQEGIADATAIASLSRYRNFDVSMWSTDNIVKALGTLMKKYYPNAKAGQKFSITYVIYAGGTSSTSIKIMLNESGNYQLAE
ncbi:hypothetical protein [Pontibacter anaerobius]|uniref:DUF5017 domain-containing protein n=1 Tax=Pontibacter anaerobius TaxID=2993940 RepID=A0ABT3RCT0_9BACT|nr:hypothetical protein [Pontibacter anaerobius]MCX2739652.1 hypothetical protein [Pontibacter anaerobius]